MKKLLALLLALAMTLSLAACGGTNDTSEEGGTSTPSTENSSTNAEQGGDSDDGTEDNADDSNTDSETAYEIPSDLALEAGKEYKVGVVNWVDDASLNQIIASLETQLDAIGAQYGCTFNYADYESNAQGDQSILPQIGTDLIADEVDVIVAVATPTAAVMQASTENTDIPVVFSAVSDPVGSQLAESMDAPGGNMTGTSDALNTTAILDLMLLADPDMKTLGLLYDTAQDSSTQAIADAKAWCDDKGITYEEKTGSTVDEISLAAQSLIADQVDAVFTPTDNSVMTAELTIYELFCDAKIPHYTGADSFALNGAFLGYGVDYIQLGNETANMVAEVLAGEDPATMAIRTFDNGIATVNSETCEAIGLDLGTIKELFAPYCTEVRETVTAESFE